MSVENIYEPFDFSQYKVYVIKVDITKTGVTKIEDKLPLQIERIRGLYFTTNASSKELVIGYVTLNLNEGIINNIQIPVLNVSKIRHNAHPILIYEQIKSNSILQGFFFNRINSKKPFTLKIYIHYQR